MQLVVYMKNDVLNKYQFITLYLHLLVRIKETPPPPLHDMYKYPSANSHYAACLPTGYEGLGMISHSIEAAKDSETQSPADSRLFWVAPNSSCQP